MLHQVLKKKKRVELLDKIIVFKSKEPFIFAQAKLVLEDHGIPFQERTTMDSMFNAFGNYELYVSSEFENQARKSLADAFR